MCQRLGRIHLPKVQIGGLHEEELVLDVAAHPKSSEVGNV